MRGHIIPQVYQKKWHTSVSEENVFYFDKNDLTKPLSQTGGNVEKNLYKVDEYIINQEDNDNGLTTDDSYELEHFLDKEYENIWNKIVIDSKITDFLESVINPEGNVNCALSSDDVKETPFEEKLLDYLIMQYFRIFDNFLEVDGGAINFIINTFADAYNSVHPNSISEEEKDELLNDINFKRTIWKFVLLDCKDKNNDKSLIKVVRDGLKDLNLCFIYLKNNISTRFILSDNPIIWNNVKKPKYGKLETGIYFPILPNLLVAYFKFPKNDVKSGDVLCLFGNDDFAKYVNSILTKNSTDKVGFMCKDILNHIDESVDFEKAWNLLFVH